MSESENLTMRFNWSTCPGVRMLEATKCGWVMPVGMIWFLLMDRFTTISLCNALVVEPLRRRGIMTAMFNHILKTFPEAKLLITDEGTEDFGKPWLIARGFKDTGDRWEYKIKRE